MRHPGISTSFPKLVNNGLRYYLSPSQTAASPLTIYWSINSICNLKCKMCDVGQGAEDGTFFKNLRIGKESLYDIELNAFKSVIDEVKNDRPYISLNSTEPLLYKPLMEALEYCTQAGLGTSVTTGGYNLPMKADDLARVGLSRLNVSMDGPADIHNYIRGRPDSFERDIEGIIKFSEACKKYGRKAEICINCTIMNQNHHSLVKFVDSISHLPLDSISFCYQWYISGETAEVHNKEFGDRFRVSESCFSGEVDPTKVDIDVLQNQIDLIRARNDSRITFLPDLSKEDLRRFYHEPEKFVAPKGKCMASWFFVQILANGNVIPYTRCHNESFGNINKQSFGEIWNGLKMKSWRKFIKQQQKMPMCRRCDLIY